MKNKRLLLFAFIVTSSLYSKAVFAQSKALKNMYVSSPDKNIVFRLDIVDAKLKYSIQYKHALVIEPSNLAFKLNGKTLGATTAMEEIKRYKADETYSYRGVHSTAVNNYNGAVIAINAANAFQLDVKVFNNGVAFRYLVDGKNKTDAVVVDEDDTQFSIPTGSIVWSQPDIQYYEGESDKQLVDTMRKGTLMGPPATIELPAHAGFAAVTEGGLTNFAGMSLKVVGQRIFQANLTGNARLVGKVETPWRIVEIGKDLNTLVNCDIIADVSAAYDKKLFPKGYETDWIKPGRSVWSWLAGRGPVTFENMEMFTDYAAKLGFEYNLVDEGWANWKDSANHLDYWDMMKKLVDYSTKKGIGVWVWKAYPDRGNIPGIKDPIQRRAFFKKCKNLGIVGLKIDFFNSESQEIIQFYQAALRDAAEFHLMMDFHGANKPTGEERTWPNEMNREAIRGLENDPPHAYTSAILPFTRYLAGHADFTPVHFGDRLGESSWANQVADMVVFTSPFLCLAADPQSILDNPCKEMIQSIPTVWDETIVLPQSKIGELAVYARRKGSVWFLAAISGSKTSKTISIDLSFLKDGNYTFSLIKDDKGKQDNAILENKKVTSLKPISITLNAYGGFVGKIYK